MVSKQFKHLVLKQNKLTSLVTYFTIKVGNLLLG